MVHLAKILAALGTVVSLAIAFPTNATTSVNSSAADTHLHRLQPRKTTHCWKKAPECQAQSNYEQKTSTKWLIRAILDAPPTRRYFIDEPIACSLWVVWVGLGSKRPILPTRGLCAYYRNMNFGDNPIPVGLAKRAANALSDCPYCGSTRLEKLGPLFDGELVIEYTEQPCDLGNKTRGPCPGTDFKTGFALPPHW